MENMKNQEISAFTMAEILISLTIIGIIAAITLPSLIGNINEKTFSAKRKAFYSRMSQAISMLPSLNGYGVDIENETNTANNAANAFVTNGLSKVLKINNICDYNNISKCGFTSKITTFDGSKINVPNTILALNAKFSISIANSSDASRFNFSMINTKAVAFETSNKESVIVYYNPNCRDAGLDYTSATNQLQGRMCANFVYDLNGKKGPNKVGKDIGFMTAINPVDSTLVNVMFAGLTSKDYRNGLSIREACHNFKADSKAPSLNEGAVIAYNINLIYGSPATTEFWVLSPIPKSFIAMSPWSLGYVFKWTTTTSYALYLYCIRR